MWLVKAATHNLEGFTCQNNVVSSEVDVEAGVTEL